LRSAKVKGKDNMKLLRKVEGLSLLNVKKEKTSNNEFRDPLKKFLQDKSN